MTQSSLPDLWYTLFKPAGVDLDKPGIYCWVIDGVESYIGRYSDKERPTRHYGRIIERYRNGGDYRKSNPNGFRRVHIALSDAEKNGAKIELHILENVEAALLQEKETEWIQKKRPPLNGPATVC